MRHLGDITGISGGTAPVVDCIIGGSPCQDLSVAGKREGLAGARSGLFMEQIRIVKEMRARERRDGKADVDIRPRYMVWENVPGAFSSNEGEDFRVVLEETARVADENAVIPRPEGGKWTTAGCVVADGWSIAWRVLDAQFWGVPQRRRRIALVADFGGESAPEILFERKGVCGDTQEGGTEGQGASASPEGGSPLDDREGTGYALNCNNDRHLFRPVATVNEEDIVQTLNGKMGTGGGNTPLVLVVGVGRDAYNSGENAKFGMSIEEELQPPLTAKGPGAVAAVDFNNCIRVRLIVRRLTPLECERLQGFPDGWTDIGAWTDSKGKPHKESSDSARYKALGNSIALPPWKWILKRLCACYERDATMASLFDGIGGFPLLWEQLNGKGTCLWSSEIEEFPIAVTKERIGD